jgi:glucose-6-phosphate-specific signal transduction histidine kinase
MLRDFVTTNTFWVFLIILTSFLSLLIAIFSLSRGINDLFPYFFLIPMFLVIYRFPQKGVLFTVTLGWINITLVYVFGTFSARILAIHTAWFYIYVSLGVVISSIVVNSRIRKEQVELLKKKAFQQIEHNMEQFEILSDEIRNPLQAIMLDTDTIDDAETKERISDHVHTIEKILIHVDDRILESHKVRKFLRNHYDFDLK